MRAREGNGPAECELYFPANDRRLCNIAVVDKLPPAALVPFARVRTYRLLDFFAGCGAMSRGFVDTGRFAPIFAVENDPRAAASYAANFPMAKLVQEPIQQVEEFPDGDVVIGGPPCQGFSTLNRAGADVASRRLWQEY